MFECLALQHVRDKYSRLFSGSSQIMQQFTWQSDVVGVVHYVHDSLLVLLADGEGGERSSNQPQCGWHRCACNSFIHSFLSFRN